jgi:hypothetical protein
MSLPLSWVERIFSKLGLAYGRDFLGRWEGLNIMDVKTDWGHELSGYEKNPEAIAYALANLPARAPTVFEFRQICRNAPVPTAKLLEEKKADSGRVADELGKLRSILSDDVDKPRHDPKSWARRLKVRNIAADRLSPIQIRFYKEALGEYGVMSWQ